MTPYKKPTRSVLRIKSTRPLTITHLVQEHYEAYSRNVPVAIKPRLHAPVLCKLHKIVLCLAPYGFCITNSLFKKCYECSRKNFWSLSEILSWTFCVIISHKNLLVDTWPICRWQLVKLLHAMFLLLIIWIIRRFFCEKFILVGTSYNIM